MASQQALAQSRIPRLGISLQRKCYTEKQRKNKKKGKQVNQKRSIRSRVCCEVGPSSHRVREDELKKLIEIAEEESTARGVMDFLTPSWLCAEQAEKAIEEIATFIQKYNEKTPNQKIVVRRIPATDTPPTYPIGFIIRCVKPSTTFL